MADDRDRRRHRDHRRPHRPVGLAGRYGAGRIAGGRTTRPGCAGAARSAGPDRRSLRVGARRLRLGQLVLLRGRAGGDEVLEAMFFGSFDSSNFISVDKPPGSLSVMDLSARVFGVNSWSILVPQALEGVATVAVLYATVRRRFGPVTGLIAGAGMATTPVAALMFPASTTPTPCSRCAWSSPRTSWCARWRTAGPDGWCWPACSWVPDS